MRLIGIKAVKTSLTLENEYTVSGYRFSTGWAKKIKKVFLLPNFLSNKKHILASNHKVIDGAALKVKNFDSIIFDAKKQ
jgi:hypothetical protein